MYGVSTRLRRSLLRCELWRDCMVCQSKLSPPQHLHAWVDDGAVGWRGGVGWRRRGLAAAWVGGGVGWQLRPCCA
eukprot:3349765-Prymnesium_polylepis.1